MQSGGGSGSIELLGSWRSTHSVSVRDEGDETYQVYSVQEMAVVNDDPTSYLNCVLSLSRQVLSG